MALHIIYSSRRTTLHGMLGSVMDVLPAIEVCWFRWCCCCVGGCCCWSSTGRKESWAKKPLNTYGTSNAPELRNDEEMRDENVILLRDIIDFKGKGFFSSITDFLKFSRTILETIPFSFARKDLLRFLLLISLAYIYRSKTTFVDF